MPGVIKLNPAVYSDKRDAAAVAWNEALRLFMEDTGFEPVFEVTPEQEEFFKDTAYATGNGTSDEKGGNVLGKLDPALWGGSDGKPVMRAATAGEVLAKEVANRPVLEYKGPGLRDVVNAGPATGNPVVDTVTAALGVATTFGPAVVSARGGGGMGGLVNAAGASRGAPNMRHVFEGNDILPARAKALEENTELAYGVYARTRHPAPIGITFDPGRAYRRIGGTAGLRDLLEQNKMDVPIVKPKSSGIDLGKQYGAPFLMSGRPAIEFQGPITIETSSNAINNPSSFGFERKQKGPQGYIYAKVSGRTTENISRIFHDDGTVIYSKARDGLASLLPKVNEWLIKNGEAPVPRLGAGNAAKDEAARERAEIITTRTNRALSGLAQSGAPLE